MLVCFSAYTDIINTIRAQTAVSFEIKWRLAEKVSALNETAYLKRSMVQTPLDQFEPHHKQPSIETNSRGRWCQWL